MSDRPDSIASTAEGDAGRERLSAPVAGGPAAYLVMHGAAAARFDSLTAALEHVAQLGRAEPAAQEGAGLPDGRVEILFLAPGQTEESAGRMLGCRYVDPLGGGESGDGSELLPWDTVETAVGQLARLHASGELRLEPGQRLALCQRPVFSATRLEMRKRAVEVLIRFLLLLVTLSLVAPVVAILGYLLVRAWPSLSLEFLLENPQNYMTSGGIWAPLVGTFFLVLISLLVAAPLGVLAGVYLNEYAGDNWATRLINLAVMNLAGVPSIVHALFGVGAFVLFAGMGRSLMAASCTLAVMTLPVIITSTREALSAVPMSFREACWNLGATRWQTIRTIVLPNSISGILTGVILQVSRAAGETAPILFTGAVFFVPIADHGWHSLFPYGPGDRCMALSMHLFTLCTQVNGVAESVQYGTAVVLVGLVLAVNSASIGLRAYLRSRKRW